MGRVTLMLKERLLTTAAGQAIGPKCPEGMEEVDRDEFFVRLYADKRPIMPTLRDSAYYSTWEEPRTGTIVGRSYPGWRNPGDEKAYFWTKR